MLAGQIAENKGRDNASYCFLALFLSPLVGILAAVVATPKKEVVEKNRIESGTEKKCPFCAELIKSEAKVCRFCGRDLPEIEAPPGVPRFNTRAEYYAWKAKAKPTP